jgi:hypothetical protein
MAEENTVIVLLTIGGSMVVENTTSDPVINGSNLPSHYYDTVVKS